MIDLGIAICLLTMLMLVISGRRSSLEWTCITPALFLIGWLLLALLLTIIT